MSFDISHVLDSWDYEPGQIVVRRFTDSGGCDKIQLRLDLGLLQMMAHGRPDGKKPFNRESLLDHFKDKAGDSIDFKLTAEECSALQQEAIQFHHRYICLFQLQDYDGVLRDTNRNAEAYEMIRSHGPDDGNWSFSHLFPQLLMLRTRATGMIAWNAKDHRKALDAVENGLEELKEFFRSQSRPDLVDQSGEIQSLEAFLRDIESSRPVSEKERLEKDLNEAVRREEYERAANIRDRLRSLSAGSTS